MSQLPNLLAQCQHINQHLNSFLNRHPSSIILPKTHPHHPLFPRNIQHKLQCKFMTNLQSITSKLPHHQYSTTPSTHHTTPTDTPCHQYKLIMQQPPKQHHKLPIKPYQLYMMYIEMERIVQQRIKDSINSTININHLDNINTYSSLFQQITHIKISLKTWAQTQSHIQHNTNNNINQKQNNHNIITNSNIQNSHHSNKISRPTSTNISITKNIHHQSIHKPPIRPHQSANIKNITILNYHHTKTQRKRRGIRYAKKPRITNIINQTDDQLVLIPNKIHNTFKSKKSIEIQLQDNIKLASKTEHVKEHYHRIHRKSNSSILERDSNKSEYSIISGRLSGRISSRCSSMYLDKQFKDLAHFQTLNSQRMQLRNSIRKSLNSSIVSRYSQKFEEKEYKEIKKSRFGMNYEEVQDEQEGKSQKKFKRIPTQKRIALKKTKFNNQQSNIKSATSKRINFYPKEEEINNQFQTQTRLKKKKTTLIEQQLPSQKHYTPIIDDEWKNLADIHYENGKNQYPSLTTNKILKNEFEPITHSPYQFLSTIYQFLISQSYQPSKCFEDHHQQITQHYKFQKKNYKPNIWEGTPIDMIYSESFTKLEKILVKEREEFFEGDSCWIGKIVGQKGQRLGQTGLRGKDD